MKKFIKNVSGKISEKVNCIEQKVAGIIRSFGHRFVPAKKVLAVNTAETYIDTAVKVIIGVVVGGVILTGFYALFNTTVIPTLTSKITQMFSYSG